MSGADRPILVVGATGMLGRPVASRLRSEGVRVRVLSRDPARAAAALGEGYEYAPGDVRDPASLAAALGGCRGVHINLRAGSLADMQSVEAEGVGAVARAAAAAGVERLTYLSGAGMEAGDPALPYVRAKQAAEAAVMASGVPFTILRATHFMEGLNLFIRGRAVELLVPQPHRFHYLAVEDYAGQVARAYGEPRAAGLALTLLGPEPYTMREALQTFVRLARPELSYRETPLWLVKLIGGLTGKPEVKQVAALFSAFQQLPETGDRAVADALVGPATTTLAQWCRKATHSRR